MAGVHHTRDWQGGLKLWLDLFDRRPVLIWAAYAHASQEWWLDRTRQALIAQHDEAASLPGDSRA